MKNKMKGKGMDRMPNIAFRVMSLIFKIRDMFVSMGDLLDEFNISRGQTLVDYGCGPGSYIKKASELVGSEGKVFAVDIHELAIKAIEKRVKKENLTNVSGCFAPNGICPLDSDIADIIYALDMFHMVSDASSFLRELNRILKPDGFLYIDNGHQPREEAKSKIDASGAFKIIEENKLFMKCKPVS